MERYIIFIPADGPCRLVACDDGDSIKLETLQELVDEGKIRHAGVSNYDAAQLAAFDRTRPVETLQPPYHLFRRGIEQEVLPYTREHNIGVLAYSPLASGLLTGTLTQDATFEDSDWRANSSAFRGEMLRQNLAVVDRLKEFAEQRGITVSQLAIAWVLAQEGVHVAIVGARSARNIENSLAAAEVDLSAEDLAEIERITEFIASQRGYVGAYELPEYTPEGGGEGAAGNKTNDLSQLDSMFEEVARFVVQNQQGSTSSIQRRFSIGYNRAGRIMDQLEMAGVVGRAEGSKPREVLIQDVMSLEHLLAHMND